VDEDHVLDFSSIPNTPFSTHHGSMISLNAEASEQFKEDVVAAQQGLTRDKSTDCLLTDLKAISHAV
jgi:hypothetical protein